MAYSYDKDHIKNSLTIDQVADVVSSLGGYSRINGDVLVCETICHNYPGEGSHKLYYYDNTKLFKCYTECGEYFDVFDLVLRSNTITPDDKWTLYRAIAYIANKFNFSAIETGEEETDLWKILYDYERLQELEIDEKRDVELKIYDDIILDRMSYPIIEPWEQEGISRDVIKYNKIGYYPKDSQITIPHYDEDGRFIGLRGRTLVKEDGEKYGKYRPILANGIMYRHPLRFNLYGLDKNRDAISKMKKVFVFEAEKSVLLYSSHFGIDNNISVATCGNSFSTTQFELLMKYGVEEIIIAYDKQFQEKGDREFKGFVKNLTNINNKYSNLVRISFLFDKKDLIGYKDAPIDRGPDIFLQLFKNRIML